MFKAVVHLFSVFQIYSSTLYLFFNIERSPPAISCVEKKGNSPSAENDVENDVVFSIFSTFNSIKVENNEKRNEMIDCLNVEMLKYSLTFRKKRFSLVVPRTTMKSPGKSEKTRLNLCNAWKRRFLKGEKHQVNQCVKE